MNKYLIGVSGGPDSMALLDMARRYGLDLICLHVNYQKRETAKRDELIVKEYCDLYNIPFFVKYAGDANYNFQTYARDFRYQFFKEIGDIYHTNKLLVAHQFDDYLETLLMQIKHGGYFAYYGLNLISNNYGLTIYRPLLKYTKNDLEHYCDINDIRYGIDESNLEDHYTRNKIRHHILNKVSYKAKLNLFNEVNKINEKRYKQSIELQIKYTKNVYDIKELFSFNLENFLRIKLYPDLSKEYLKELIRQIKSSNNMKTLVRNKYLTKEYGKLYIYEKALPYTYTFENIKLGTYEHFKLVEKADKFHSCKVSEKDFPITIRNYQAGDKIKMRYGTKKLSRYFIDNKIESYKRDLWPVVLNKDGEIILVPKIGSNITHYDVNTNLNVVELFNTEDF